MSPPEALQRALDLARTIVDKRITRDGAVGWLGLDLVGESVWTLNGAGSDFYGGIAGIAHTLGVVGRLSGDELVLETAMRCHDQLAHYLLELTERLPVGPRTTPMILGAYGPVCGALYSLAHASGVSSAEFNALYLAAQPLLTQALHRTQDFDIMRGTAGTLLVLTAIRNRVFSPGIDELIEQCTRALTAHWSESGKRASSFTGFAHGFSGSALALARTVQSCDSTRGRADITSSVATLVDAENALLNATATNWLDLRERAADPDGMLAWCNGAPGIGASRLELSRLLPEVPASLLVQDIRRSAQAIRASFGGRESGVDDDSLCHGDLSNLLTLRDLSAAIESPVAPGLALAWSQSVQRGIQQGWRFGPRQGTESLGFMCGLAGVSWALARWACPEAVSNVLVLEAPRQPS